VAGIDELRPERMVRGKGTTVSMEVEWGRQYLRDPNGERATEGKSGESFHFGGDGPIYRPEYLRGRMSGQHSRL
jgi:hypothetical protein